VLKVVDGARRAAAPAAIALLRRLGALDDAQAAALRGHAYRALYNAAGTCVGSIAALDGFAGELA